MWRDGSMRPDTGKGIGGVFFRSPQPATTCAWYRQHLGLRTDEYGTNFAWRQADDPGRPGYTQWSPFAVDTSYFGAGGQQFMINHRVGDLAAGGRRIREDARRRDQLSHAGGRRRSQARLRDDGRPSMRSEMMRSWISLVPSKILVSRASRQ